MPKLALIHHPKFISHDTGAGHPETPLRLAHLYDYLKGRSGLGDIDWITADCSSQELLRLNHTQKYIEYISSLCVGVESALLDDGDTRVSSESFNVALLAASAAKQGVDLLLTGDYKRVFVASRPPGHHALEDHSMGFCLFNNVAIAAEHALRSRDVERVMIIDWDVHHGNGTQDSFFDRKDIFFCSIHQSPHYPGTGFADEIGNGDGVNHTLNIPVAAGAEIDQYLAAFEDKIIPAATAYQPQLIIISAGFDAHKRDPLGDVLLESGDFGKLTDHTVKLAQRFCEGKLLSILEGGYHIESLAKCVEVHLRKLSSD